jgi:hypothetical protein
MLSFKKLLILIGEQLNQFPGLIQLQYRLDGDKPTVGATRIRSQADLKQFEQRMRLLIVPQKLRNGKISTRILKPVRVCFEDVADEVFKRKETSPKKSTENRVRHRLGDLHKGGLLNFFLEVSICPLYSRCDKGKQQHI